jgi:hypothetical protein
VYLSLDLRLFAEKYFECSEDTLTLYHPVYSGLGLNLFAEKYFEHCQYG